VSGVAPESTLVSGVSMASAGDAESIAAAESGADVASVVAKESAGSPESEGVSDLESAAESAPELGGLLVLLQPTMTKQPKQRMITLRMILSLPTLAASRTTYVARPGIPC
jgi:hypothetical protein